MKLLPVLFLSLSLICFATINAVDTVGGLTLAEWDKKCKKYFREHVGATDEKGFLVPGHCERYICQKYGKNQYGMRIDECPTRYVNGKACKAVQNTDTTAKFPVCCKYHC